MRPPAVLMVWIGSIPIVFPVLLLWPIALAVFAVSLPILMALVLIARPRGDVRILFAAVLRTYGLVAALRGLTVDVERKSRRVQLTVR